MLQVLYLDYQREFDSKIQVVDLSIFRPFLASDIRKTLSRMLDKLHVTYLFTDVLA